MTEPTDDEIDALVAAYLGDCGPQATRVYSFARAVLAKWGTPPAVAGDTIIEAPSSYQWITEPGSVEHFGIPGQVRKVVANVATPQPTQAQAGAELAEADRRAGAAERELASCREDVARFTRVRDQMKEQWGVDRNVSFDVVWAEALRLKQQAGAVPPIDWSKRARELQDAFNDPCLPEHSGIGIKGGQHG